MINPGPHPWLAGKTTVPLSAHFVPLFKASGTGSGTGLRVLNVMKNMSEAAHLSRCPAQRLAQVDARVRKRKRARVSMTIPTGQRDKTLTQEIYLINFSKLAVVFAVPLAVPLCPAAGQNLELNRGVIVARRDRNALRPALFFEVSVDLANVEGSDGIYAVRKPSLLYFLFALPSVQQGTSGKALPQNAPRISPSANWERVSPLSPKKPNRVRLGGGDHFLLDALHGIDAHANLGRDLADTLVACSQCPAHLIFLGPVDPRAAKLLAFGLGPGQPGIDALADHAALELGKDATHLEHGATGGRRRVQGLLMKVQIAANRLKLAHEAYEVLQTAAKAINGPGHNHVNLAARGGLAKGVKGQAFVPALGTAYAVVDEALLDLPAHVAGDLFKLAHLVICRLPVCRDSGVNGNSLRHGTLQAGLSEGDYTESMYRNQVFSVHARAELEKPGNPGFVKVKIRGVFGTGVSGVLLASRPGLQKKTKPEGLDPSGLSAPDRYTSPDQNGVSKHLSVSVASSSIEPTPPDFNVCPKSAGLRRYSEPQEPSFNLSSIPDQFRNEARRAASPFSCPPCAPAADLRRLPRGGCRFRARPGEGCRGASPPKRRCHHLTPHRNLSQKFWEVPLDRSTQKQAGRSGSGFGHGIGAELGSLSGEAP